MVRLTQRNKMYKVKAVQIPNIYPLAICMKDLHHQARWHLLLYFSPRPVQALLSMSAQQRPWWTGPAKGTASARKGLASDFLGTDTWCIEASLGRLVWQRNKIVPRTLPWPGMLQEVK